MIPKQWGTRKECTRTRLPFVTTPFVRSTQLEWALHWIALPEIVHIWFVLPVAHVQICNLVPSVIAPLVTSRHLDPKIRKVDPDVVQPCEVDPPATQSSISTAAPSVLDAAVRHFAELTVGWMYVAVAVGPDGAVEEKTGVPVWHGMAPPHAAPGSGVPSHVHADCVAV